MGTRSVIGVIEGDGFKGRYCHWDGYPTHHGPTLAHIIHKTHCGDLAEAVKVLTENHHGWSALSPEKLESSLGAARSTIVPGVGEAYSDDEQPDEWITFTGKPGEDYWGTEWAYIFDVERRRLSVFKVPFDSTPKLLGSFDVDQLDTVDWDALEEHTD